MADEDEEMADAGQEHPGGNPSGHGSRRRTRHSGAELVEPTSDPERDLRAARRRSREAAQNLTAGQASWINGLTGASVSAAGPADDPMDRDAPAPLAGQHDNPMDGDELARELDAEPDATNRFILLVSTAVTGVPHRVAELNQLVRDGDITPDFFFNGENSVLSELVREDQPQISAFSEGQHFRHNPDEQHPEGRAFSDDEMAAVRLKQVAELLLSCLASPYRPIKWAAEPEIQNVEKKFLALSENQRASFIDSLPANMVGPLLTEFVKKLHYAAAHGTERQAAWNSIFQARTRVLPEHQGQFLKEVGACLRSSATSPFMPGSPRWVRARNDIIAARASAGLEA